jgi:hypothetical protein
VGTGVDPAFERTVQAFVQVGDSGISTAVEQVSVPLGIVPGGQNWLVERLSITYRPGAAPTDPQVIFQLLANAAGPSDIREGTFLVVPSTVAPPGMSNDGTYRFYADEASPVRFFAGEQVIAHVKLYGSASHPARLTVVAQIRAVEKVPQGADQGDTTPVEPSTPADETPPHEPAWN